jgi:hypothetical protein
LATRRPLIPAVRLFTSAVLWCSVIVSCISLT